ncbi:Chromatin structure remodeling complex protein sfh1 [Geranomyces variabilis]|uniref:Chromatin structure remodeling complex protein sfh1 n=1 Tax=Geranomyces variabilis TaxID=109894 RepID=A0AAD5TRU9_9FUNG|nr:Chromatin structure remodeling complex protein sfh1 [Geranomyces variabilis]
MSSYSPAPSWPIHHTLSQQGSGGGAGRVGEGATHGRHQHQHQHHHHHHHDGSPSACVGVGGGGVGGTNALNSPSFYPSPPIDFITTDQEHDHRHNYNHQQHPNRRTRPLQLQTDQLHQQQQPQQQQHAHSFAPPFATSPLTIEQKFSPNISPVSALNVQQTHHPTSALAAAIQYQAMGPPALVEVTLCTSLADLQSLYNTGLLLKEQYESERNQHLHAFTGRSEDRMVLLKGLKDAWDGKLVTDSEFDSISASLFGAIDGTPSPITPSFSNSVGTSIGGTDVGSWMGTSIPETDMFGASFPGVDMSAGSYKASRQQPGPQRRATSNVYYPSHPDSSQLYGSPVTPGIPIPMHRGGSANSIPSLQDAYTPQPQHLQSLHHPSYMPMQDSPTSPFPGSYDGSPSFQHHFLSQSAPPVQFLQQSMRSNSMSSVHGGSAKRVPSLVAQLPKPKKDWRSKNPPNPMLLNNQIHQMLNSAPPPPEVAASPPPPSTHRGFGASARQYNCDGSATVSEFRMKWRCRWCLCSGKYTPALRKGPLGAKTLCNACGMWYNRHGYLPKDRYREHANDDSNAAGATATSTATESAPAASAAEANVKSEAGTTPASNDIRTSEPGMADKSVVLEVQASPEANAMRLITPVLGSPMMTSPNSPYGINFADRHQHQHQPQGHHTHHHRHPSQHGDVFAYLTPTQENSQLPEPQQREYPQQFPHHYSMSLSTSAMHYPESPSVSDMASPVASYMSSSVPAAHSDSGANSSVTGMDYGDSSDEWLFGPSISDMHLHTVPVSVPNTRRPDEWN